MLSLTFVRSLKLSNSVVKTWVVQIVVIIFIEYTFNSDTLNKIVLYIMISTLAKLSHA